MKDFSANNDDKNQLAQNQSLIKQVEEIMDSRNSKVIQDYLSKAGMSSEILTNYLYNLQALASYYMYHAHDGPKARTILLHAKSVAENYVNSRSTYPVNFNQIFAEEILSELQPIKHLPEVYTRIIYYLGRTHIYIKDYNDGVKYFELAKYLGTELKLYESYLSDVHGLLVILKQQSKNKIYADKVDHDKVKLLNLITDYEDLTKDSNKYIIDYDPKAWEQKFVTPSTQPYNLASCENYILQAYNILCKLSTSNEEVRHYITTLTKWLKDNTNHNIFHLLSQISQKRAASIYNSLGNILITLQEKDIKYTEITNLINSNIFSKQYHLTDNPNNNNNNELIIAEALFEKAKSLSRNVDFTKADAYDGLVKIIEHKINSQTITESERNVLQLRITELTNKRDIINQKLNRN